MFLDMHLVTLLVLLLVMLLAILPEKFEPEIAPGMNPAWRKNVILAANENDLRKCSMESSKRLTPGSILTGPWNTGILVGMLESNCQTLPLVNWFTGATSLWNHRVAL